jgi:hypothetical protein
VARGTKGPVDAVALVEDFKLYDRSVDVVSAYHWLFTETNDLPPTVAHFERYPRITHPDGNPATPDFTVLFTDGTGIAAEIANIALPDNSVERLCEQLDRYSRLTELPGRRGSVAAAVVDVLYLAPMDIASSAVRRVLVERADKSDHPFKPVRRPVVVQFANTPDKYIFQFWPNEAVNGQLHTGDRTPNYASFTELNVPPSLFAQNKITYGFMNDPIKPLYMATRLWASVLPSEFGAGTTEVTVTAAQTVDLVRTQYGHGNTDDIRAGMQILVAAGLAVEQSPSQWTVKRRNLRSDPGDVHVAIAERVSNPDRRLGSSRRATQERSPDQGPLFD